MTADRSDDVRRAIDNGGAYTMVSGKSIRDDGKVADLVRVWVVDDEAASGARRHVGRNGRFRDGRRMRDR